MSIAPSLPKASRSRRSALRTSMRLVNVGEADILHGVRVPVTIIEVPPFKFVHRKTFGFHRAAQQSAVLPLLARAAAVIGMRSLGHLVISTRHLHGAARGAIEKCQVDSATAVVPRPMSRICDVLMLVRRRGVPEDLRDVPGAIRVVDQQAITFGRERTVNADNGLRRRTLKKCARLLIEWSAEKIVRCCVADVEADRRIE